LPARSNFLGDPTDPKAEGDTKRWKVGGPGKVPDALVIVAADDPRHLAQAVRSVTPRVDPAGKQPKVIWKEQGNTRPDKPGHEHFGFKDGISQPGVRGFVSRDPDIYLTPRRIDPADPRSKMWSEPGQPLVWPGHFVLGYPILDPNSGEVIDGPALKFPWFRNGSYLVFRRLRQDVRAFRGFVKAETERLKTIAGFTDLDADRLASILIGRWPHGAPILRADHDDQTMGANSWANNNFLYANASPPAKPAPGGSANDPFPPAPQDLAGLVCPHASHIRKANPRDLHTEFGDEPTTLVRRILRRGIPFGKPLADPPPAGDRGNRGLHFLCYQASISLQFESLTHDWANQAGVPQPGGHDPVIGQKGPGEPARTFVLSPITASSDQPVTITINRDWVIPTGGGYFFAPSVSAIRERLCKATSP
jgi:Dyp-type peroxidase family